MQTFLRLKSRKIRQENCRSFSLEKLLCRLLLALSGYHDPVITVYPCQRSVMGARDLTPVDVAKYAHASRSRSSDFPPPRCRFQAHGYFDVYEI